MSNANTLELGMLSLINAERALAGLDPLRLITTLNAAAEDHSRWMLETDTFTHSGADGSSPSDRMEAAGYPFEGASLALENIGWQSARGAEGFEDDVAQVHEGLMASPGHRANILDPNAEDIGIGIEIGTFSGTSGDYEAVMVTQVFGSTEADLSAWVDPGTGEPEDEIVNEDEDPTADETPPEEPSTETPEDDPIADGTEVCDDDHLADVEDDPVDEDVTAENTGDDIAMETEDPLDEFDDESSEDTANDTADDNASEDMADDTPEDDPLEDVAEDTPEDDLAEDDPEATPEDLDEETDLPSDPMATPPFDLTAFTVDLSSAFEFRKEGDDYIWETSEDQLIDVFLRAFEEQVGALDAPEADIMDLMIDTGPDMADQLASADDELDDWLLESCA